MSDYLRGWMQGRATVRNRALRDARQTRRAVIEQTAYIASLRRNGEPNWRVDVAVSQLARLERNLHGYVCTARRAHWAWLKYRRWRAGDRALDARIDALTRL